MSSPTNNRIRSDKILEEVSNPHRAASMRHRLFELGATTPGFKWFLKPDPINRMHQSVSSRVRDIKKTVKTVGKDSVKVKSVTSPLIQNAGKVVNRFKGLSGKGKAGVIFGSVLVMGMFLGGSKKNIYNRSIGSNYLPEKYSRGYDTIKENMTDFGSRVHLSKTASKVNITPRNTTRDATIRTTSSVTNSNISLQMHKGAIGHTRY
jgi:hypothetical protein